MCKLKLLCNLNVAPLQDETNAHDTFNDQDSRSSEAHNMYCIHVLYMDPHVYYWTTAATQQRSLDEIQRIMIVINFPLTFSHVVVIKIHL